MSVSITIGDHDHMSDIRRSEGGSGSLSEQHEGIVDLVVVKVTVSVSVGQVEDFTGEIVDVVGGVVGVGSNLVVLVGLIGVAAEVRDTIASHLYYLW